MRLCWLRRNSPDILGRRGIAREHQAVRFIVVYTVHNELYLRTVNRPTLAPSYAELFAQNKISECSYPGLLETRLVSLPVLSIGPLAQ